MVTLVAVINSIESMGLSLGCLGCFYDCMKYLVFAGILMYVCTQTVEPA